MYGGIGVSAPSLHRESTDSLIYACNQGCIQKMELGGGQCMCVNMHTIKVETLEATSTESL